MSTITAPEHKDAVPAWRDGKVEPVTYVRQTPPNPRVQTVPHSSPLLDLEQGDDMEVTDTVFATTPQQELRVNRNQTKRPAREVPGDDNSPQGTPPSDGSLSHKRGRPSQRSIQVLPRVLLHRNFLKCFPDCGAQPGIAYPCRVNAAGGRQQ